MSFPSLSSATVCVHHPEPDTEGFRSFAVPVYRASTIVFDNAMAYRNRLDRHPDGYVYGLGGTPTTRVLENQLTVLNEGVRSIIVPSGQAAIAVVMLTVLEAGDHVLIADNCYPPVRELAINMLAKRGVSVDWFDPTDLEALEHRVRTLRPRLIWLESPGSTSMEVCDIPAIVAIARSERVLVGCDNTWATALFCKPIVLGVDFVAEALTKYIGGHSDILLGAITFADPDLYSRARTTLANLGIGVSPDDCSLALRGFETVALRLDHVGRIALEFARRLSELPGQFRLLHPALPGSQGHDIWRRDFSGSTGLFTLLVRGCNESAMDEALDRLETFAIGASWGGTRSLVAPQKLTASRQIIPVDPDDTYLRISVGLEDPDDLWRDIETVIRSLSLSKPQTRTDDAAGPTA